LIQAQLDPRTHADGIRGHSRVPSGLPAPPATAFAATAWTSLSASLHHRLPLAQVMRVAQGCITPGIAKYGC